MQITSCQTQYSRQIAQGIKHPQINTRNCKPYRTVRQKALARKDSYRTKWGHWSASTPVTYHQ